MATIFDSVGSLGFGSGGYSDDLAGWSFGGGGATSFNTGADYTPATPLSNGIVGWAASNQDAIEQAKMGAAYPNNGQAFDFNAATLGISRLIDTGLKGYVAVKGAQAATYAGQNGLTYVNGQTGNTMALGGNILPLLLLAGAALLLMQKG
jgi:hypothetical protein